MGIMKEKQEETILHFISGQDIFVSLSTGYGKSLLFGILPLVCGSYTCIKNLAAEVYKLYNV